MGSYLAKDGAYVYRSTGEYAEESCESVCCEDFGCYELFQLCVEEDAGPPPVVDVPCELFPGSPLPAGETYKLGGICYVSIGFQEEEPSFSVVIDVEGPFADCVACIGEDGCWALATWCGCNGGQQPSFNVYVPCNNVPAELSYFTYQQDCYEIGPDSPTVATEPQPPDVILTPASITAGTCQDCCDNQGDCTGCNFFVCDPPATLTVPPWFVQFESNPPCVMPGLVFTWFAPSDCDPDQVDLSPIIFNFCAGNPILRNELTSVAGPACVPGDQIGELCPDNPGPVWLITLQYLVVHPQVLPPDPCNIGYQQSQVFAYWIKGGRCKQGTYTLFCLEDQIGTPIFQGCELFTYGFSGPVVVA